jgi:hypothetical protein
MLFDKEKHEELTAEAISRENRKNVEKAPLGIVRGYVMGGFLGRRWRPGRLTKLTGR